VGRKNIFKTKGRSESASFVRFEHRMLMSATFLALSGAAVKTLLFLASQFNGKNNGDLTLAIKVAQQRGMPGSSNLRRAAKELLEAGFIILTRQGGRNRCSLYALSWFPIDECGGKLDVPATRVAPNDWLRPKKISCSPEAQLEPAEAQLASANPWDGRL
jgi:hypothetical protein